MNFKSHSIPAPYKGQVFNEPKAVVPNQSMSLEEILRRFTRGEPLEIGRDGAVYDDGPDDLEKVAHMDPVDKQEFVDRLKTTQKNFEKQEKKKAAQEKDRLDKLAVEKLAADKKAAESQQPNAK